MSTIVSSIPVDGQQLCCADVFGAGAGRSAVRLAPEAEERIRQAHDLAVESETQRPLYGRSTGVGANRQQAVEADEAQQHALRLLRSHAGGTGPELATEVVRSALLVRLNQLAAGGSGVHPRLAHALVEALNSGSVPHLRTGGAIGTGDLSALSTLALTLAGELPWSAGGMGTVPIGPGDALAFISSSAVTLAESVHAWHGLHRLLRASHVVTALSFRALDGSPEAIAARVHALRPHPGAVRCAAELRRLLYGPAEPERTGHHPEDAGPEPGKRLQDPFGLRSFPQVQGPALEAVDALETVLTTDLNSVTENPMIDVAAGQAHHHGQFSTAPVALALDHARAAVHHTAQLSAARLGNLVEPALTELPPFLAAGPSGSSGIMILEFAAHDALSTLRQTTLPVTLGTAALSRGLEDHASFAGQAARATGTAVAAYRTLLACELLAAVRALSMSRPPKPGTPAHRAYEQVTAAVPVVAEDHVLTEEIAHAETLLDQLADL